MPDSSKNLDSLIAYSRNIGADSQMIQAAGGNTSFKSGDKMWIKASGRWLADIQNAESFIVMVIERVREMLARPEATDADMLECISGNETSVRPSVEVPMHAVIPYRYVVHSHCVDVIAIAIQRDAEAQFSDALDGLEWAFLPYLKPGVPLSREVSRAAKSGTKIFVLANHGLIVAADTLEEIDRLTRTVLARFPRAHAADRNVPDIPKMDLAGTGYGWANDPLSHQIAFDATWTRQIAAGSFAPDLLVFLGPALPILDRKDDALASRLRELAKAPLPMNGAVVLPGVGVALREDAFIGTEELLRCARDVLQILPRDAEIAYFTEDDSHDLLNWDAEKYRQALNAQEV